METDWSGRVSEIVRYLNDKTRSSFRAASTSTKKPIIARIREGYSDADFRAVVDEKSQQWMGNDTMERYLRPQTLFGSKFESYLQEARRHDSKVPNSRSGSFRDGKELLE